MTVGKCDNAELYELVGAFFKNKISERFHKNITGLYCNDGFSVFKNKSGTQFERIKKSLRKTFR